MLNDIPCCPFIRQRVIHASVVTLRTPSTLSLSSVSLERRPIQAIVQQAFETKLARYFKTSIGFMH